MEKFLAIKTGMAIEQVEAVLNEKLVIEQRREEYFKSDIAHFEAVGVWLFFNIETSKLDTIRYELPFNLSVDGLQSVTPRRKSKN